MQHLSEPLNKYLISLVNKESNAKWANTPNPKLPKNKKVEILKNNPGWYNLIANTIKELKP